MKIGLLHFRVYETDGVSLEMDKWRYAFEKLGHEVVYISGSESDRENHIYIEELYYKAEYNKIIYENAFKKLIDFNDETDLLAHIFSLAKTIEEKLKDIILNNKIDVLVPNNISSLGFNLPVGIAIGELNKKECVNFIYHHHDFYFERIRYSNPLFASIQDILDSYFPYKGNAIHCTINEIAKSELIRRRGIIANVIPNVFDFNQDLWEKDDYNNDLRSKLRINESDLVFLQATRIVKRKGIELGYLILETFSSELKNHIGEELYSGYTVSKDTKVHLVLAGLNEYEGDFESLDKLINRSDIVVHYINDIVDHNRGCINGNKVYSLWDVYTMCDFITYPSVLEGWGNQLLEGLFARKPILVFEYPVFKSDISEYGFNLTTFSTSLVSDPKTELLTLDKNIRVKKSKEIYNVLFNSDVYQLNVSRNFEIAKKSLSYDALINLLKPFIEKLK